ncbi:MAG: primase C-terminal domain-containing protein [Lachnospiraceae bacterium]|nr:primase C-terminal domain-containing protein [Lachnospiraceae bacterium]
MSRTNNCFPKVTEISTPEEFKEAVKRDHVCGKFKDFKRSNANFIESDVEVFDCDNMSPVRVYLNDLEALFGEDTSYFVATSRSHLKEKDGAPPAERFHVYFPHRKFTSAEEVTEFKKRIYERFRFFDQNVLDASRMIFGNPDAEIIWHEGIFLIEDVMTPSGDNKTAGDDARSNADGDAYGDADGVIHCGRRNSTLSHFAGKVLKKYGDTDRARAAYEEEAMNCEPPLRKIEIETIWNSAKKFFHNVVEKRADYKKYAGPGEVPPFILSTKRGESVSPPLLVQYFRDHVPYLLVRDSGTQGMLFYVYEQGVYKIYAPEMVKGLLRGFVARYDKILVRMAQINEAYQIIITDLNYTPQEDLNSNEDIVNFQNGLLRLSTMTLEPHDPKVLSTIQLPCNWKPDSPTPVFDKYLNTLVDNRPDIQKLLFEFMGACLSNIKGYKMKKALFMVGEGNTGKSQIRSLVEKLLGKGNYANIDLRTMEARFGTSAIYGTRLAGTADMSFLTVDELKTFKKITGGDSIFAEYKCQQGFSYTYNGLLWFCMNQLPKFGGDDGPWVYDRILVVNCPNVIPKACRDKQLLDKMYEEREGIVYKALCALKKVIENGYNFTEPVSVVEHREQYRNDNSSILSFFNECMGPCESLSKCATTGKVFKVYKAWCEDNNNRYYRTAKEFREGLSQRLGVDLKDLIKHTRRGNVFEGYTINEETRINYAHLFAYEDETMPEEPVLPEG